MARIARYTTVWVYKIILSTENHPINITKFEIPQVIGDKGPVKLDAGASIERVRFKDASGSNVLFQWILRWCFTW